MAERLTELDCYDDYQILEENLSRAIDKLGKLEDILEKYGIESLEKLSNALEFAKVIENILSEYGIKDNEELDKKLADGITWKRACELACEDLQFYDYGNEKTEDGIIMKVDYFYQQAKKKGNDE